MTRSIFQRKPMLLALALTGAVGVAGVAFAQQYPSTSPSSPSSPAASPSTTTDTSATHSGPTTGGMSSSKATMPLRTESADAAWQKLGSKGYVSKDDVKDLSGFSFETADVNHDGRLTQDEFRQAWARYQSQSGASSSSPSSSSSSSPSSSTTPK